jgi:hypothetical protein
LPALASLVVLLFQYPLDIAVYQPLHRVASPSRCLAVATVQAAAVWGETDVCTVSKSLAVMILHMLKVAIIELYLLVPLYGN